MFRFYLNDLLFGPPTNQLKWIAKVQEGVQQLSAHPE